MSAIEMVANMSKIAIKFMTCIKYQINFVTEDIEKDNFYYCAAL